MSELRDPSRRALRATGLSIALHAAVFACLSYAGHFDAGLAMAATSARQAPVQLMQVALAEPNRPAATASPPPVATRPGTPPNQPLQQTRQRVPAPSEQAPVPGNAESPRTSAPAPVPEQIYGHYTEGKLTKLPSPLTDIDLNIPTINGLQYTGRADLTVLIDADGRVLDVLIASETDSVNAFADRVAARFREARFAPGEIDGVAVKSALHAVVVSESLPTAPAK